MEILHLNHQGSKNYFRFFSILSIALICGCMNNKKPVSDQMDLKKEDTVKSAKLPDVKKALPSKDSTSLEAQKKYVYENDTIKQTLDIVFINKRKIEFKLVVDNKIINNTKQLKGAAIGNVDADPETDEDAEGYAYPAIQYVYGGAKCELDIRVAMEKKDKVQINGAICDSIGDIRHPFHSVGVMNIVHK